MPPTSHGANALSQPYQTQSFGTRMKTTDHLAKIDRILRTRDTVDSDFVAAVDPDLIHNSDTPRISGMLSSIMAKFDFENARFPLYVVRNVVTLLEHTKSSRYWSVPIMRFLLKWLETLNKSPLDGIMLNAGRGKKLASTVATAVEAIGRLVHTTKDEHVS